MAALSLDSFVNFGENHIEYDGNKYFRRNAGSVELGSHGRMKKPAFGVNYMSVSAKIARRHLENRPIKVGDPIEVNWSSVTDEELNQWGILKFFGVTAGVADTFNQQTAIDHNLKLVRVWINENPLTKCLNEDADAVRESMAKEGKDARVVSSILILMDSDLATHFASQSDASITVSSISSDLGISAGTGRVGTKTIQLTPGTTIGYGLHKVKKWTKNKEQIDRLEDEWFSFG
jgi:hypothetical protein